MDRVLCLKALGGCRDCLVQCVFFGVFFGNGHCSAKDQVYGGYSILRSFYMTKVLAGMQALNKGPKVECREIKSVL